MIYLSPPQVHPDDQVAVLAAMASGWLAPVGPALDVFEAELGLVTGQHVVALSSGTAAIHLGLKALGVGPGDLVLVPTLTFAASLNPILYLGAQPILIDADPETGNISLEHLSSCLAQLARIDRLPKAIIVVDLFGMPAPTQIIRDHVQDLYDGQIKILEDAAEALGSYSHANSSIAGPTPNTYPVGHFADITVWSFNGNKIISTSGGGALGAHDPAIVGQVRKWATQSKEPVSWYEHQEIGYNYRMSNVLAALGSSQLSRLKDLVLIRQQIYDRYAEALAPNGIIGQSEPPDVVSNRWLPVFRLPFAHSALLSLCATLATDGIECRSVWKPMHQQPYLQGAVSQQVSLIGPQHWPNSDHWFRHAICLPTGPSLSLQDQQFVIDRLLSMVKTMVHTAD